MRSRLDYYVASNNYMLHSLEKLRRVAAEITMSQQSTQPQSQWPLTQTTLTVQTVGRSEIFRPRLLSLATQTGVAESQSCGTNTEICENFHVAVTTDLVEVSHAAVQTDDRKFPDISDHLVLINHKLDLLVDASQSKPPLVSESRPALATEAERQKVGSVYQSLLKRRRLLTDL